MNSPDILRHIYSFLNYHDSKKLLINKEFKNILHKEVHYERLAAKKILVFFLKNNIIVPHTKKDYIRYIIRKYNNEQIYIFNNAYSRIQHLLSIEQYYAILPIANIIYCTRRDVINFLNILTVEQIRYIIEPIYWYNFQIYQN
jgi:hypothetical protein